MINLFKAENGMNIVGQGGKIIIFTLPFALAAVLINLYLPKIASLPDGVELIRPAGYVLLILGVLLWISAVFQLFNGFPRGKLITKGAYGFCRNPIYSSMILFILPAISLLTLTWVYLILAVFLYVGVVLFIGKEETQLMKVFGSEYSAYKSRVSRIVPFVKPRS
jgi:protein-S-isoprenylcysteine O-methyltransferase Ste14